MRQKTKEFSTRQIQIIQVATKLIDTHGIQNLTIKNLANDIGISEAGLYRHFKSKNHILLRVLDYFILEMQRHIASIIKEPNQIASQQIREVYKTQLQFFTQNPAVVSVIFSEGIFQYDQGLSEKVSQIIDLMQNYLIGNLQQGQAHGLYSLSIDIPSISVIILGSIRMTVLKWKLSGHQTNLVEDGQQVLNTILTMIENK